MLPKARKRREPRFEGHRLLPAADPERAVPPHGPQEERRACLGEARPRAGSGPTPWQKGKAESRQASSPLHSRNAPVAMRSHTSLLLDWARSGALPGEGSGNMLRTATRGYADATRPQLQGRSCRRRCRGRPILFPGRPADAPTKTVGERAQRLLDEAAADLRRDSRCRGREVTPVGMEWTSPSSPPTGPEGVNGKFGPFLQRSPPRRTISGRASGGHGRSPVRKADRASHAGATAF